MPAQIYPNLGLKAGYDEHENGWANDMTENIQKLSVLVQGGVSEKVAVEPTTPAEGTVVLLDETNATNPNAVAAYISGAWKYWAPLEGWLIYNRGADYYEKFDGAVWAELATGGSGGGGVEEAPEDDNLYARKNAAWEPIAEDGSTPERRSARYWRIRAIGLNPANTGGNPTVGFAGVDFRDSTGASLVSGGTAIASSFTSGYPASNAFDSDVATSWYSVSNRNNGEWIGYDFGHVVTPYSIALTPNFGLPQGSPRSFALESSSDGTTWAPHSVYYADSEWVGSTVKTFAVPLLNTRVATGITYRVGFFVLSALAASEVAAMHVFTDAVTFPANFAGSRASVGVNPAATFVLSVQKNGTEVGTISVSTAGVVTFATSGAAAVAFAAGDVLRVVGPATVGTAANFAVTLLAAID